jgi:heme exporter protein A
MLDGVLQNVAAAGRTVVMTSHDLARAEDLGTRFDVLTKGRIGNSIHKNDLGGQNLLSYYKSVLSG